jgi:hypothetical protein
MMPKQRQTMQRLHLPPVAYRCPVAPCTWEHRQTDVLGLEPRDALSALDAAFATHLSSHTREEFLQAVSMLSSRNAVLEQALRSAMSALDVLREADPQ